MIGISGLSLGHFSCSESHPGPGVAHEENAHMMVGVQIIGVGPKRDELQRLQIGSGQRWPIIWNHHFDQAACATLEHISEGD